VGPVGGWGGWGPQEALPAAYNQSMRNASIRNASVRQIRQTDSDMSAVDPSISGNGMEWLAVGLPQAGFGFGTPMGGPSDEPPTPEFRAHAQPAARTVQRYDSHASDASSEAAGAGQEQGLAPPVLVEPGLGSVAEEEEGGDRLGQLQHDHHQPPSPQSPQQYGAPSPFVGAPGSLMPPPGGMLPRPGRLPPLQHAGSGGGAPPLGGTAQPGSFSFVSLSSVPSAPTPVFQRRESDLYRPRPDAHPPEYAERYEADAYEAMTMSIGQISLHDTLATRAARLRADLGDMLGAEQLAGACAVVRAVQARVGVGSGDMGNIDIREMHGALVSVLGREALSGDQGADLMAWLDELVFLESRPGHGDAAWA